MEFDLTPNRADALSMVGTAYEVAALYQTDMAKPQTSSQESSISAKDELSVSVKMRTKYLIIVQELFMMSQLHHHQSGCKHV